MRRRRCRRHILSKLVNPTKGTYSVEVYEMCTAWKCVTAYSNKIEIIISTIVFLLLCSSMHKQVDFAVVVFAAAAQATPHRHTHAQLTAAYFFFANFTQFYIFFTFLSTRHLSVAVALQLLLVLKLHGGDYRSQHLHSLASCRCD